MLFTRMSKKIILTVHDFLGSVSSLLLDSDLMKQENLLFDNMEDPSQYVHDNLNELNTILGELNTGSVWRNSVKMCWVKKKLMGYMF
jgi:hypothetical protein